MVSDSWKFLYGSKSLVGRFFAFELSLLISENEVPFLPADSSVFILLLLTYEENTCC